MQFTPNTLQEKKAILTQIGLKSSADLFSNIPSSAFYKNKNGVLKNGLSEMEVLIELQSLSDKNHPANGRPFFLGAGSYRHFIPSAVNAIISRGEFLTAYTPYQPEASQGTLQATFEFQTMIAELYGMDVANASLYDGATAVVEAAHLSVRETGRKKILISSTVHPEYRKTLKTYAKGIEIVEIPWENGLTQFSALEKELDGNCASLIVQNPNFFGCMEDGEALAEYAHRHGALLIVSQNPISLGLMTPPGAYGADIAVGEGQPLGISMEYGGPYLGLFACKEKYMRKIPGRIVGLTKDLEGKRGFVLTLQTREQHIRREKASSNICTNEALMALAATVYLSLLGPEGLKELALLNIEKAHLLAERLRKISGYSLKFTTPTFNEFVLTSKWKAEDLHSYLLKKDIVGGLPLNRHYSELGYETLFCVTELTAQNEIEQICQLLEDYRG